VRLEKCIARMSHEPALRSNTTERLMPTSDVAVPFVVVPEHLDLLLAGVEVREEVLVGILDLGGAAPDLARTGAEDRGARCEERQDALDVVGAERLVVGIEERLEGVDLRCRSRLPFPRQSGRRESHRPESRRKHRLAPGKHHRFRHCSSHPDSPHSLAEKDRGFAPPISG
jgi:hypothetical protein